MLVVYCRVLRSTYNRPSKTEKIIVLFDSACGHSCISKSPARKWNVQGTVSKLTVHGNNSHRAIDAETVKLRLTPFHSGGSCPAFVVKTFVRKAINVITEVVDAE